VVKRIFEPFNRALRQVNFVPKGVARVDGMRVATWIRRVSKKRTVAIQLWSDGRHVIGHSVDGQPAKVPTEFETVEEMLSAIDIETTEHA
jgi:hypothetical protein